MSSCLQIFVLPAGKGLVCRFLLKVNLSKLKLKSDGRRRTHLILAALCPVYQMAAPLYYAQNYSVWPNFLGGGGASWRHATWSCLLLVGNALSTAYFIISGGSAVTFSFGMLDWAAVWLDSENQQEKNILFFRFDIQHFPNVAASGAHALSYEVHSPHTGNPGSGTKKPPYYLKFDSWKPVGSRGCRTAVQNLKVSSTALQLPTSDPRWVGGGGGEGEWLQYLFATAKSRAYHLCVKSLKRTKK